MADFNKILTPGDVDGGIINVVVGLLIRVAGGKKAIDVILPASITGPVAKAGGVLAIVAAGLGLAFSEGGGFMRKVVGVVFGLAITFSATTFISDFLGYTGGVRF